MTRNDTLNAAIAVTIAHRRHAEAVDSLRRVKMRGDTQAQRRAQARVTDALHDLMQAEQRAARYETI
jgi:hypothetical protein